MMGRALVDAGLSAEETEFQKIALDFAAKEIAPHAAEWDEKKFFPKETLQKCAQLGFAGQYIPQQVRPMKTDVRSRRFRGQRSRWKWSVTPRRVNYIRGVGHWVPSNIRLPHHPQYVSLDD